MAAAAAECSSGPEPLLAKDSESRNESSDGCVLSEEKTFYDFREALPSGAYLEEVATLALTDEFRLQPVPMGLCVGPAVPRTQLAVVVSLALAIAMFFFTFQVSHCTPEAFAEYPVWLWAVVAGLTPFRLVFEWYILIYTTVPYTQVCGSFRIFGVPVRFHFWLTWAFSLSTLNVLDFLTDSFFAATAMRTERCEGEMVTEVFQHIMANSMVRFLPIAYFHNIVLFVWVLSFMQLLYPLVLSMPRCGEHVDYKVGTRHASGEKYRLEFKNLIGTSMNLGNALFNLCEALGMSTVQTQNPWYSREKAQLQLKTCDRTNLARPLAMAEGELQRGIVRFGLVALLENALQVNLQITTLGINRALMVQQHTQWQMLLSILLSMIICLVRMGLVGELIAFSNVVQAGVEEVKDRLPRSQSYNEVTGQTLDEGLRVVRRYTHTVRIMAALFFLTMGYAFAKLIAVYICRDSVWNITGCVDLSDARSDMRRYVESLVEKGVL